MREGGREGEGGDTPLGLRLLEHLFLQESSISWVQRGCSREHTLTLTLPLPHLMGHCSHMSQGAPGQWGFPGPPLSAAHGCGSSPDWLGCTGCTCSTTSSPSTSQERGEADPPLRVKGVAEKLGPKWDIRKVVLVLYRAQQVHAPGGREVREKARRWGEAHLELELELLLSPLELYIYRVTGGHQLERGENSLTLSCAGLSPRMSASQQHFLRQSLPYRLIVCACVL